MKVSLASYLNPQGGVNAVSCRASVTMPCCRLITLKWIVTLGDSSCSLESIYVHLPACGVDVKASL